MKKIFLPLSAVLLIATLLSACGPTTIYTQSEPPVRTITVSGTGMVTLTPDLARINIGVQTQDASAAAAMDENSLRAEALIAAIKAFGVADEDIQTSNFTISPQPVYDDYYNVIGTTYMVVNTVHVTVRDLDTLGRLLDAAFEAGANDIYGIQFDVSNRTEAVAQARLGAVEDARRQAEELAAATGVRLGEVQAIAYYDSTPYPVYLEMRAATDSASSVPIEVGSMEITTTVNIVYAIK